MNLMFHVLGIKTICREPGLKRDTTTVNNYNLIGQVCNIIFIYIYMYIYILLAIITFNLFHDFINSVLNAFDGLFTLLS